MSLRGQDADPAGVYSWFWGRQQRSDIENHLQHTVDGTFLLFRDEGSPNYTIALRCGGRTEYVTLLSRDGFYGFTEPLQFDDVEQVLEAYSGSPSALHELKFALAYQPGGSQAETYEDIRGLLLKLKKLMTRKSNLSDLFTDNHSRLKLMEEKLMRQQQRTEGLEKVLTLLETHMKNHQRTAERLGPSSAAIMSANFATLNERYSDVQTKIRDLADASADQQVQKSELVRNLGGAQTEMEEVDSSMDVVISHLQALGLKTEFIDGFLAEGDLEQSLPHHDSATWLMSRDTVFEPLFRHALEGTFVVRPTMDRSKPYCVHVMHETHENRVVVKFPILEIEGRYGFDPTTCVFDTLLELVLMYSRISFRVHDTKYENLTLKTPAQSPSVYNNAMGDPPASPQDPVYQNCVK